MLDTPNSLSPLVLGGLHPLGTANSESAGIVGNVPYRMGHISSDKHRLSFVDVGAMFSESVSVNEYEFVDVKYLSKEAIRSLNTPNAGGKSALSEALSIDYFNRIYSSHNTIDEMKVPYKFEYKMVDFLTSIPGTTTDTILGVSVTRGMGYPRESFFTSLTARSLLSKKLSGLVLARNSINKSHRFYHGILHVFCQSRRIADIIFDEFNLITEEWNDKVCKFKVILSVCTNDKVYYNRR